MKAVGYIRVSTNEQAESGLSLAYQTEKIKAYATALDLNLVKIIEDAGASAKDLNREGLQKAISMIEAKEADTIIILKLDRLTRSVKDLGIIVELVEKYKANLISVQDSINTSTAGGRLVLNVLGSVAQWEREANGERVKAALSVKRAKGERLGAAPFGYELNKETQRLEENPQEQRIMAIMRELRASGLTLQRIADELTARGIRTKTGGKWYPTTIKNVIERQAA